MTEFSNIIDRRYVLKSAMALGIGALLGGKATALAAKEKVSGVGALEFTAVAANGEDTVTLPAGFNWQVVVSWGDPLWSDGSAFDAKTRGDAASQARAMGDNNDGMAFFKSDGRQLLVVNSEYVTQSVVFGNRSSGQPENADDVAKGMLAHGVNIFEVRESAAGWQVVKDSPINRRITPQTTMALTGPARGSELVKTTADPAAESSLGTWNNCGNGTTPWGTYLACEENFNGYFSTPSDPKATLNKAQKRYGISNKDRGLNWASIDERFDVARHPNEPNRVGYVVEIDPNDASSIPKKRTALGRFKHENCEIVIAANGQVVAYMGDDQRGEFIYRFVSHGRYQAGAKSNVDLLESGDLYVAKFFEDGSGEWLLLDPSSTGMSAAEIAVYSRLAASKVGATTMDRPEWVASHPQNAEVYCCLTNNKHRGKKTNAGGDEMPAQGPNPRVKNRYGQIVRWRPAQDNHTDHVFSWDLFLSAGNPAIHQDAYAGSDNINVDNMFNSPDGLAFDSQGNLWIQTDGSTSNKSHYKGMGNNQMLVANPQSGEVKRFMVGPKECEVTGLTWSDDRKTLFVGIQHPGYKNPESCHFPDGGDSVPRSSIIAIKRDDGGLIG